MSEWQKCHSDMFFCFFKQKRFVTKLIIANSHLSIRNYFVPLQAISNNKDNFHN